MPKAALPTLKNPAHSHIIISLSLKPMNSYELSKEFIDKDQSTIFVHMQHLKKEKWINEQNELNYKKLVEEYLKYISFNIVEKTLLNKNDLKKQTKKHKILMKALTPNKILLPIQAPISLTYGILNVFGLLHDDIEIIKINPQKIIKEEYMSDLIKKFLIHYSSLLRENEKLTIADVFDNINLNIVSVMPKLHTNKVFKTKYSETYLLLYQISKNFEKAVINKQHYFIELLE